MMKTVRIAAAISAVLALASVSSAAITEVGYYKMGDVDPGAANGVSVGGFINTSTAVPSATAGTIPSVGTATLTSLCGAGGYLTYSNDVPTDPLVTSSLSINFAKAIQVNPGAISLGNSIRDTAWPPVGLDNYGVEMWVKTSVSPVAGKPQTIINVGNAFALKMYVPATGTATFTSWTQPSGEVNASAPNFVVDQWNHLALVRDNGTFKAFVNGVDLGLANTNVPTGLVTFTDIGLGLAYTGGSQAFVGKMDEVRMFTFDPGQFQAGDLQVTVPEPTMIGLAGLSVLGLMRRRHRA